MPSVNKVTILGHMGGDPELKEVKGSIKKLNFSVATSEAWKHATEGWKSETQWHRIVCWGQVADRAAEVLKKGDLVFLEGKLKTYEFLADEVTHRLTEIHASTVYKLRGSGKKEELIGEADKEGLPF